MKDDQLPPSLAVAKDVTEEEYQRARMQNILLWTLTCLAAFGGVVLFILGLRVIHIIAQGVLAGVGAHVCLRTIFKDASKMSTMRMVKYPALKSLRSSMAKLDESPNEQAAESDS